MIPIDQQIALLLALKTVIALQWKDEIDIDNILNNLDKSVASLQRLKAIESVQVPEEPEEVASVIDGNWSENSALRTRQYIDTLRDLLKRESARADTLQAAFDEAESLLFSAGDISCANGKKHQRHVGCLYCRIDAAERQLAAMLKLGAKPSDEMKALARTALKISSIKSDADAAALFSFMFAKLIEQAGVKK